MAKLTDKEIEKIWDDMKDIPFDFDDNAIGDMVLAEDYYIWKSGTDRDEIWHWFDNNYSKGVYWLIYERED